MKAEIPASPCPGTSCIRHADLGRIRGAGGGPSWTTRNALTSDGQDAQSIASVPDFSNGDSFTGDFSDTLPLFTMRLSRPDLSMDIAFLAQETVVGPNSVDGAGVMLTFKAPRL